MLYQEFIEQKNKQPENLPEKLNLSTIFNSDNNGCEICKDLMNDLELTLDNKPNPHVKKGRVGKLTGLISAIKDTPGMLILDRPQPLQLLTYFNSYLNISYKTFSKRNETYTESLDTSTRYIKLNFKK